MHKKWSEQVLSKSRNVSLAECLVQSKNSENTELLEREGKGGKGGGKLCY